MNVNDYKVLVFTANARGTMGQNRNLWIARSEFPTSTSQYQNMCQQTAFQKDACGRAKKQRVVRPGDFLYYVDISSKDYAELLTQAQHEADSESSSTELTSQEALLAKEFDARKKHILFPIIKSRDNKRMSLVSFGKALNNIRKLIDDRGLHNFPIAIVCATPQEASKASSIVDSVLQGLDVTVLPGG